jgi:hypothetical protein
MERIRGHRITLPMRLLPAQVGFLSLGLPDSSLLPIRWGERLSVLASPLGFIVRWVIHPDNVPYDRDRTAYRG